MRECVQSSGPGRGHAVDSMEGFLEPEEGRTETKPGGAEVGGLGEWGAPTSTLTCQLGGAPAMQMCKGCLCSSH